jgi:hypothetical protein
MFFSNWARLLKRTAGAGKFRAYSQSTAVLRVALGGRSPIADLTRPPFEFPAVIDRVLLPEFLRRLETCDPQAATHCD